MAEFNIPKHGDICWRELATKDLPAALEFYSKLFGWTLQQTKITDMEYKEIVMNAAAVAVLNIAQVIQVVRQFLE